MNTRCYEKAISLLAGAEHCRKGLARKLSSRGFDEEEITAALQRLTEENLLDDRRFAGLWIEFRQRRTNEGRRLLEAGLLKRGVDRETAAAAVNAYAGTEPYNEAFDRARERILRAGEPRGEELVSGLLRKGFTINEIRSRLADRE